MNTTDTQQQLLQRNKNGEDEEEEEENFEKKKKIINGNGNGNGVCSSSSSSSTTAAAAPNWLDLPTSLLHSVLDLVASSSISDFFAFAAVCPQWRSLAKSSTHSLPPPPLLLFSLELPPGSKSWKPSRFFLLQTLTPNSTPFNSAIMSRRKIMSRGEIMNRDFIACSQGHLIFGCRSVYPLDLNSPTCSVIVATVFSPRRFCAPPLPPAPHFEFADYRIATLTASSSSPSCMLLFSGWEPTNAIFCWNLGANGDVWTVIEPPSIMISFAVLGGRVFGLSVDNSLWVFQFTPTIKFEEVRVRFPNIPSADIMDMSFLGECNGEALLVLVIQCQDFQPLFKIQVYRLDLENLAWMEVKSIGDWCLLCNWKGGLLACPNPTRWGGRSNCLYIARCGIDSLSEFPLDGTLFPHTLFRSDDQIRMPCVWVYPRKVKSNFFSIHFSQAT